jgi:hypothetical protein
MSPPLSFPAIKKFLDVVRHNPQDSKKSCPQEESNAGRSLKLPNTSPRERIVLT